MGRKISEGRRQKLMRKCEIHQHLSDVGSPPPEPYGRMECVPMYGCPMPQCTCGETERQDAERRKAGLE